MIFVMVLVNYTCYVDVAHTCFLHVILLSTMESAVFMFVNY